MLKRRSEYTRIVALLNAVDSAGFNLGGEDRTHERLLKEMFEDWRVAHERSARRWERGGKFGKWIAALLGGALVTLFGPDMHQWLKSHWP